MIAPEDRSPELMPVKREAAVMAVAVAIPPLMMQEAVFMILQQIPSILVQRVVSIRMIIKKAALEAEP